jgi:hypothetical protein
VIFQLPFDVVENVQLVSVPSLNHWLKDWFELQLGKLTLVKISCWSDEGERQEWELFWPGPDNYHVDNVKYADPVSAAHEFYLNCIAQHT